VTKRCTKCGEVKGVDCFSKHIKGANGLRSYCRSCARILRIEYGKNNKDILRSAALRHYYKDIEKSRHECRIRENLSSLNLTDRYLKAIICDGTTIARSDIPPELIALKRTEIQIKRQLKEMKKHENT